MKFKRKKPNRKSIERSYRSEDAWSWKKNFVRDYRDKKKFKRIIHNPHLQDF